MSFRAKKIIVGVLSIAFITSSLVGCGGRAANPVATYYPTDETLSCRSLVSAMDEAENNIQRLIPDTKKTGKNIAIGAAGVLLFWPALFFLDFSDAEKIEIEAYRNRYNHLARIYQDKGCAVHGDLPKIVEMPKVDTNAPAKGKKVA